MSRKPNWINAVVQLGHQYHYPAIRRLRHNVCTYVAKTEDPLFAALNFLSRSNQRPQVFSKCLFWWWYLIICKYKCFTLPRKQNAGPDINWSVSGSLSALQQLTFLVQDRLLKLDSKRICALVEGFDGLIHALVALNQPLGTFAPRVTWCNWILCDLCLDQKLTLKKALATMKSVIKYNLSLLFIWRENWSNLTNKAWRDRIVNRLFIQNIINLLIVLNLPSMQ